LRTKFSKDRSEAPFNELWASHCHNRVCSKRHIVHNKMVLIIIAVDEIDRMMMFKVWTTSFALLFCATEHNSSVAIAESSGWMQTIIPPKQLAVLQQQASLIGKEHDVPCCAAVKQFFGHNSASIRTKLLQSRDAEKSWLLMCMWKCVNDEDSPSFLAIKKSNLSSNTQKTKRMALWKAVYFIQDTRQPDQASLIAEGTDWFTLCGQVTVVK
jgi:hypothetical protein